MANVDVSEYNVRMYIFVYNICMYTIYIHFSPRLMMTVDDRFSKTSPGFGRIYILFDSHEKYVIEL